MVSIRSIVLMALAGLAIGTTSASATLGSDKLRHLDNLDLLDASLGEFTAAAPRALMTSTASSNDEEVGTPSPSSSQTFTSSPSVSSTSGGPMETTPSPTAIGRTISSMAPTTSPVDGTEGATPPPSISGAATSAILPGVVALVSVGVAVVASIGV